MARNYQQAKIYMICSNDKDCIPYIGSSCKRLLSQRMNQHRDDYKKWKKGKHNFISSFSLFETYGIENCYIDLIQSYPCNTSDELRARERRWINDIKCLNLVKRVIITEEERVEKYKEYRDEHKEQIAEKKKEWYEANKEEIAEKKKKYYEANKEEIAEKKKIHYDEHKEEILLKNKEYRDKHKEEIIIKDRIKYHKNRHELTKKHQDYLTAIGTHTAIA